MNPKNDKPYISKYVDYDEAIVSSTGLPNVPTEEALENMRFVAQNIFDRVREHFRKPIGITSFYRSPDVNKKVGGAITSQHMKGEAIDINGNLIGGVSNAAIFNFIKDNLEFDQLIWEFGDNKSPSWVHVSLKKGLLRRQVLIAKKINGKTSYIPFR